MNHKPTLIFLSLLLTLMLACSLFTPTATPPPTAEDTGQTTLSGEKLCSFRVDLDPEASFDDQRDEAVKQVENEYDITLDLETTDYRFAVVTGASQGTFYFPCSLAEEVSP